MKTKQFIFAGVLGVASLGGLTANHKDAQAQGTTGAVRGIVKDKTGQPLAGVTVVATSAALQGAQTSITEENGTYLLTTLPPGTYLITFYYGEITLERRDVVVNANGTTNVFQSIDQNAVGGDIITVQAKASTIDTTTTTSGVKVTKEYIKNMPIAGRSFEGAILAAPGTKGDGLGVSVSGSTSIENNYIVDGVNTTNLGFGTVGSPVINDFLEEVEVITGGYNAEYGRSTGGVVSAVTKSGTNEFKGSLTAYLVPGQFVGTRDRTPSQTSPIDATAQVGYDHNFVAELGGPVLKDKLWFYVGFAPIIRRTDFVRRVNRRTDCRKLQPDGSLGLECDPIKNADGIADKDPDSGRFITEQVGDDEVRSQDIRFYSSIAKLNFAASSKQQGQITVNATPASFDDVIVAGSQSVASANKSLQMDVAAKWTAKFNNNKTEIEATLGWHREQGESSALDPAYADKPLQILRNGNLSSWGIAELGNESDEVLAGCKDKTKDDPYPGIDNCRIESTNGYFIGGPGGFGKSVAERRSGKLSLIQRVKALGTHEIKAGGDIEINTETSSRLLSGGATIDNDVGSQFIQVTRFVQLAGESTDPRFSDTCKVPNPNSTGQNDKELSLKCDFLPGEIGYPGTEVPSETFNWSAYLRDSWQPLPNITINAGLRYEEQRLRYAKFLQNKIDPITGNALGKNAMNLTGMFAPRLGATWDWTKEGKSKLFGSWGRYYESIPLTINRRSFGAEAAFTEVWQGADTCATKDERLGQGAQNGESCADYKGDNTPSQTDIVGVSGVLIAPGIKAQYLDEATAGVEYEIMEDLKVGIAVVNRRLGRVIEDVSTDGANTYIIANPGEINDSDLQPLRDKIGRTDDAKEKATLEKQLKLLEGVRVFDTPTRDYNSVVITASRRVSKALFLQGSYTFSRNRGNYPGLFSATNGQVDPNISSQFDLVELLANRTGPLDGDTPHNLKVDGFYTLDFNKLGKLTIGVRASASSGTPYGALGAHWRYGQNEAFLLPRGSLGRTAFEHKIDARIIYGRKFGKGIEAEIFADFFNLYDNQGQNSIGGVDDTYAFDNNAGTNNANPIVGGRYEDLIWARSFDQRTNGAETSKPLERNVNFRNTSNRLNPVSSRLGLRITF
jgi:hypothetical protein